MTTDRELLESAQSWDRMRKCPWYLRDNLGWPIEFDYSKGKLYRWIRIACQNIRKVTG